MTNHNSDNDLKALFNVLEQFDTPSVCNAIEIVQGKRGFSGFTRGTMISSEPQAPAVVGYAATATIAGAAPPEEDAAIIKQRRMDYYRHMASSPAPGVVVIEDIDFPDCIGAWWGEVNTTVHKALGLRGVLTNGVLRDLGDLANDFPVIAGSVGPSHGFVHVRAIAEPVHVFGLKIQQGDLIHADRHGAVVIPPEVLTGLKDGLQRLQDNEALILGPARKPGFNLQVLEKAWEAFEKART